VDLSDLARLDIGTPVVDVRARPVLLFAGDWQLKSALKYLPDYDFGETARGIVVRTR
jgi:hypothetical protein